MSARRLSTIENHFVSEFSFPHDPSLDEYRQRGVPFDTKAFYESYYALVPDYFKEISGKLAADPLMRHELEYELTRDQKRELGIKQVLSLRRHFTITPEEEWVTPHKSFTLSSAFIMFDNSFAVRIGVHTTLYLDSLRNLGSEKHSRLVMRAYTLKDYGCFAMTELGHGSNVAAAMTVAVYDHASRTFVLDSPSPLAAKFWIGALGKTANMAVVFAQLIIDGNSKGVHAFAVPIRDRKTHVVYPGIAIGDCGAKAGLNSIDNGFMLFRQYRVPYDTLLDRLSSIEPDGKFISKIKSPEKRFSAMLSGLIRGRLSCIMNSEHNARTALTIAIRYAAIRKQFSYGDGPEKPILDYSLHRYRLMPHLANTFACNAASLKIESTFAEIRQRIYEDPESPEAEELHAILSAFKVISTAYARDAIQECREACGGLGYSMYTGIGRLRENHDINLTWDGDNNVLIQQAARFVLKVYQRIFKGQKLVAKSLSYLTADAAAVSEAKATFTSKADLRNNPSTLQAAFEYLVNFLLQKSVVKLQENVGIALHVTEAWNMTQPFYLQDLGKAFGEATVLAEMVRRARVPRCANTEALLMRLTEAYALNKLYKNLAIYRENYMTVAQAQVVQEYLLDVCVELGESAVRIIDTIAAPDELLGSALGQSDGQAYRNLLTAIESAPGCYTRPEWISVLQEHRETIKQAK